MELLNIAWDFGGYSSLQDPLILTDSTLTSHLKNIKFSKHFLFLRGILICSFNMQITLFFAAVVCLLERENKNSVNTNVPEF